MIEEVKPWDVQWYVCRADRDDVAFAKTEGRRISVGDELWRSPLSIGPISPDHDHWSGNNLGCTEEEALLAAAAPVLKQTLKEVLMRCSMSNSMRKDIKEALALTEKKR